MSVLFVAVPAALAFAISAVIAFLWAARSGQLDDLDTPPLRMLHDGAPAPQAGAGQDTAELASSPERVAPPVVTRSR
jgi:cbb3-type cytochrome oxidase maturation protein